MEQSSFFHDLIKSEKVSKQSAAVLDASGARTPEAIMSLLQAFPTLARRGLVDSPALSNTIMREAASASTRAVQAASAAGVPPGILRRSITAEGYGAKAPKHARWQPKETVPIPESIGFSPPATANTDPIDDSIDTRGCLPWPVRDQGARGTCVAYGVTALRELLVCEQGDRTEDLSEQFLYWDIKTNSSDPNKTSDGTWVEFAFESLRSAGVCLEATWPYNPVLIPTNISHAGMGAPPPHAAAEASNLAVVASTQRYISAGAGNAQPLLKLLRDTGRPIAICLPVFSDPSFLQADNWTTNAGWLWGVVLDPPPTSVVIGGHCVCVTGFVPDASEPLGGYFVIRNSWSTEWGTQLPTPGYHGLEQGYGQVSATYVDRFLWEFGQL